MKPVTKGLLWGSAILLCFIILTGIALLLTPRIVSTDWAKAQIKQAVSSALHRPVHLDTLSWDWKDGVILKGLSVKDTPGFSQNPLLRIAKIELTVDFAALLKRRWVLGLKIMGLHAQLIRQKSGITNLEALLSDLTPATRDEAEGPSKPIPVFLLPTDVQASIECKDLTIEMDDRLQGRTSVIQNASIVIKAPSVQHKPVQISLYSEQKINRKPLPPVTLTAQLGRFLDPSWALSLENLLLNAQGTLSGLDFTAQAEMRQKRWAANLVLDVEAFHDAVSPLMAHPLAHASGHLEMYFQGSQQDQNRLRFHMTMTGKGLTAKGPLLQGISLGPVDLHLIHQGIFDPVMRILEVHSGEIRLQKQTRILWQGTVKQLNQDLKTDIDIGPVFIDVREMTQALKGVMPSNITFTEKAPQEGEKPPGITLKHLGIAGRFPSGPATLDFQTLALNLPDVAGQMSDNRFRAKGLRLEIKAADIKTSALFPRRVQATGRLQMDGFHLKGGPEVRAEGIDLDAFGFKADNMRPTADAMLGMVGDVALNIRGSLAKGIMPGTVNASQLTYTLETRMGLPPTLAATIPHAEVSIHTSSGLDMAGVETHLAEGGRFDCEIDHMKVFKGDRFKVDAQKIRTALQVGDFLTAHMNASFQDLGSKQLETDGRLSCNIKKVLNLAPARMRPAGEFSGQVSFDWQFRGRRPAFEEIRSLGSPQHPLSEQLQKMTFLEDLEILARLHDVGLRLPLSEKGDIAVQHVSTPSPFRLTLHNGINTAEFDGQLRCEKIDQLPGLGKMPPQAGLTLGLSTDLTDLRSVHIEQSLDVPLLGFHQTLSGSIDHVDRLLDKSLTPKPGLYLSALEGELTAHIHADTAPLSKHFGDGLSLSGSISAGTELTLTAGQALTAGLKIKTSALDAAIKEIQVKHLTSDLQLTRRFTIRSQEDLKSQETGPLPLSQKVLLPPSETDMFILGSDGFNRPNPGQTYSSPNITLDSAQIPVGRILLQMDKSEAALHLNHPFPRMDNLQLSLLGGTISGSVSLSQGASSMMLNMVLGFSGLDTARLMKDRTPLSPAKPQESLKDTELSGHVQLMMPITDNPSVMLSHMNGAVRITHIGSRTLERLLYALDPYESNETLVKQRRLLRQGAPKWIDLEIQYGNLSLSGEVEVKGVSVKLPQINRLNLSLLPIHNRLKTMGPLLRRWMNRLKTLSADVIFLDKEHALHFRKERP